jgi:BirA family biotin operon repressor/biotin-[acetyl-CoA-carboxylase] ligase
LACPEPIYFSALTKNTAFLQPYIPIGQPFVQLNEVESTNNYAMAQVQAQLAGHGAAWFAHSQTGGKGQRGKAWLTEPGQNIIITTVIEPFALKPTGQFELSAAIAIACYDFFSSYATDGTAIKWPNDIYWKDRKAGGILIENIFKGNIWRYAIVGIGININQTVFSPGIPNPVSLKQITGRTFDCIALARELCRCIENRWQSLVKGYANEIFDAYNSHLYKLNEPAKFRKEHAVFYATVKGVSRRGELLANVGFDTAVSYGEWEWVVD